MHPTKEMVFVRKQIFGKFLTKLESKINGDGSPLFIHPPKKIARTNSPYFQVDLKQAGRAQGWDFSDFVFGDFGDFSVF